MQNYEEETIRSPNVYAVIRAEDRVEVSYNPFIVNQEPPDIFIDIIPGSPKHIIERKSLYYLQIFSEW